MRPQHRPLPSAQARTLDAASIIAPPSADLRHRGHQRPLFALAAEVCRRGIWIGREGGGLIARGEIIVMCGAPRGTLVIARGETSAVRGEAGYGSGVLDFGLTGRAQGPNEREWRISGGLLTGRREDGRQCAFGKPYPRDTSSHRSIDGEVPAQDEGAHNSSSPAAKYAGVAPSWR